MAGAGGGSAFDFNRSPHVNAVPAKCREKSLPSRPPPSSGSLRLQQRLVIARRDAPQHFRDRRKHRGRRADLPSADVRVPNPPRRQRLFGPPGSPRLVERRDGWHRVHRLTGRGGPTPAARLNGAGIGRMISACSIGFAAGALELNLTVPPPRRGRCPRSTRSRNCSASLARRKTTTQRTNAASGIRRGAIGLSPIRGGSSRIDSNPARGLTVTDASHSSRPGCRLPVAGCRPPSRRPRTCIRHASCSRNRACRENGRYASAR